MIVYVWPRLHQNMCDELRLLHRNKIQFKIFCLKSTKNDQAFSVDLIKRNSILTFLITILLGDLPNNGCSIPCISSSSSLRKSIKDASLLCLREGRFPVTLLSLFFAYLYRKPVHFRVQVRDLSRLKKIKKVQNFFLKKGIFFDIRNNLPVVDEVVGFQPFIISADTVFNPAKINPIHLKILSVGKLENRKNLHISILLGGVLASRYPNKSFTIDIVYSWKNQGSAEILERLKALKKEYESQNPNLRINFYNEISNNNVRNLMMQSAVYFHPADDEPASYSIIEAYSMGCFVICKSDCLTANYLGNSDCATLGTIDEHASLSILNRNMKFICDQKYRTERIDKITKICNKNPIEGIGDSLI